MFFNVYLQPEVLEEAAHDGEDAELHLLSIIEGFVQNCFLTAFEDYRWDSCIKEILERWPDSTVRRKIKRLLVILKKRKRIVYCIAADSCNHQSDLEVVLSQAESVCLSLILVITAESCRDARQELEIVSRRQYQFASFASLRSDLAVHGKTCRPQEMNEAEFLDFHFANALRYAQTIHICDRVCGKVHLTANFRYTLRKLTEWLGRILQDKDSCKIVFHMGQPAGNGVTYVLQEIAKLKEKFLESIRLEVRFYDESLPDPTLPHQRFILSDQIALNIDRGLDFLDPDTHTCRDTYVNYQSPGDAQRLLHSYVSGCNSTHQC